MPDWIVQNNSVFFPGGCRIVYHDPVTGHALPPQIHQLPQVYQPPYVYQQPAAPEQLGMPPFHYYGSAYNFEQQPVPVQDMMNEYQPLHPAGSPPPYDAPGFVQELDSADEEEELDTDEDFDSVDEDMDSDEDEELDPAENMFHYEIFQHEVYQHEGYQQPVIPVAPIAPIAPIAPVMAPIMPVEHIMPIMPMMPIEYIEPIMPAIPAVPAFQLQVPRHILEQNIQEQPVARRPHQPQPKKNFPRISKAAKSQAWKALLRKWEISHMQRRMAARRAAGCGLRLLHNDKDKRQDKKPRRRSI